MNNEFNNTMESRTRLIRVHLFVRDSFFFRDLFFVFFFFILSVFTTFSMKGDFIFHFSFSYTDGVHTQTLNYANR